jgi:hypothetical protein
VNAADNKRWADEVCSHEEEWDRMISRDRARRGEEDSGEDDAVTIAWKEDMLRNSPTSPILSELSVDEINAAYTRPI